MKFKTAIAAAFAVALSCVQAFGQATILPPGETCFQATTGVNGMVGALGTITGGSLYTAGSYGGVSLTGGTGSGATANITVSGGAVTAVAILNPGVGYVVGDVLSASAASIGGTGAGFSVPVNSVSINSAVAGGTVAFYIPNTLTPKQTWQDSGKTILNTNPVQLDQNGCMVAYGSGVYRQILKDYLGNTVFDKLTAATNGSNGIFWASIAGGTGNAITVTDTAFANQDGYNLQFLAAAGNTGPATITVSGGTPIAIVNDTTSGPAALSGGEIGPGNTPMLTYDATNSEFHIVNPAATTSSGGSSSSIAAPQGYLNLVGQASGDVIQTADVLGVSIIYYSPYVGNTIPIWNGTVFKQVTFSELTTTLTAAGTPSNTIQDECVFSNNGSPTLVTGPSWTTVTAGSGNRGTGAGTAQITKLQGIWVNAVTMVGYNGLSSFSIPANQCTYVGSIYADATAGQVTAHVTPGQNRKFGIWNAYNRVPIKLAVFDPTASWTYQVAINRASNATPPAYSSTVFNVGSGTAANGMVALIGLPEESINATFIQTLRLAASTAIATSNIFVGLNSVTVPCPNSLTGVFSFNAVAISIQSDSNGIASCVVPPSLGINILTSMERVPSSATGTNTFLGASTNMQLLGQWHG